MRRKGHVDNLFECVRGLIAQAETEVMAALWELNEGCGDGTEVLFGLLEKVEKLQMKLADCAGPANVGVGVEMVKFGGLLGERMCGVEKSVALEKRRTKLVFEEGVFRFICTYL